MRQTECQININLIDVTAKDDTKSLTITDNALFADVNRLQPDEITVHDYMTLELNNSILDGSMPHLPDDMYEAEYPVFGTELSDSTGTLDNNPKLEIIFGEDHTSAGLTFYFNGVVPGKIRVIWQDSDDKVLDDINFYPNEQLFFCENNVMNFTKITAHFIGTALPYSFIKIGNLVHGVKLIYEKENIKDAVILEEIDPVSKELSVNTCEFVIFNEDDDFNALNPKGKFSLLQKRQKIVVNEKVNGTTYDMGTFYLNTWKSNTETAIKFSCVDILGLIDKTAFKKGRIYDGELATNVISEIMDSAGVEKYEISVELADVRVSGYIPVCSHREALQQVAFAIRAVVDCSRSEKIKIYRIEGAADRKVGKSRLFLNGGVINLKNYVSDIEIATHRYVLSNEQTEIFKGLMPGGINEITFDKPYDSLSVENGVILEKGVNYAIVKMDNMQECTIRGREYQDNVCTYLTRVKNVDAGEVLSTLTVKDATLVNMNNVGLLAEHLLTYYGLRKEAEQRYLLEAETTGAWVNLVSQREMIVRGCIEKQTIDLTGGFISQANIVGYNTLSTDYRFTGKELHTGERIGVV